MWPRRPRRPRLATTEYGSYLRGRLVGAGIGIDGEADLYDAEAVPLRVRVAFGVGAAARKRSRVLAEVALRRKVAELLDLSAIVAQVEAADDPGSSTPPAVPASVGVEQTARLPVRAIGDPLPSTSS